MDLNSHGTAQIKLQMQHLRGEKSAMSTSMSYSKLGHVQFKFFGSGF